MSPLRRFRRVSQRPVGRGLRMPWNWPWQGWGQSLLRGLFRFQGGRRRTAKAGFVFPTTVLMVLLVTLTTGALTVRAFNRTTSTIVARQQQVITNAATPAIDRAKAKLEYMFSTRDRFPRTIPTSDMLKTILMGDVTNSTLEIIAAPTVTIGGQQKDIYTLGDETRIDLDGNASTKENAWMFRTGVGNQIVVYAITIDDANDNNTVTIDSPVTLNKALAQVTRNGPISTSEAPSACIAASGGQIGNRSDEGWQIVSQVRLEKNIQITAFIADESDISGTISTLELQQVRQGDRSSKWGAWFRYDLENYPGPDFNWNGAMHTQGSLYMGNRARLYLISSKNSCVYSVDASDVTLGRDKDATGFHGQLVMRTPLPGPGSDSRIHSDKSSSLRPNNVELTADNDSIVGGPLADLGNISLDPVAIFLKDESKHIGTSGWTSTDPNPDSTTEDGRRKRFNAFNGRVKEVDPIVLRNLSLDDTFRADNRWGPKSFYGTTGRERIEIPSTTNVGTNIGSDARLTDTETGLDGYWERQAANSGTRWIVGQRLELGNVNGWNAAPAGLASAGDPLYPPIELPENRSTADDNRRRFGRAEQAQRRTLRDNLAAVQGMVMYRFDLGGGTTPQACIALTAHHGTAQAIRNSRTFRELRGGGSNAGLVMTDFLTGNGTNGWEFNVVTPTTGQMGAALQNLANFAGDPRGGAPSFEPVQDNHVHPYPYMAMWGDFSVLRRNLAAGNNSLADTSNRQVSACTLSLLAYNLRAIKAEYDSFALTAANWTTLGNALTAARTAHNTAAAAATPPGLKLEDFPGGSTEWLTAVIDTTQRQRLEMAYRYLEVERDRTLGFATGPLNRIPNPAGATPAVPTKPSTWDGDYSTTTGVYTLNNDVGSYTAGSYRVGINPYIFAATAYGSQSEENALSLALALAPKPTDRTRFPALRYIFPSDIAVASSAASSEEYVSRVLAPGAYDAKADTAFSTFTYQQINDIAATPKGAAATWTLPKSTSTTATIIEPDAAAEAFRLRYVNANGVASSVFVSVLDKVIYQGRENMALRVLDMDVAELMRTNWFYGKDSQDKEHYGLTYAFREDAVREDNIVRPIAGSVTAATCTTYAKLSAGGTDGCYMNIQPNALDSRDPPLANNKISIKAIDYIPDPDRRPYGFRLRNGANFGRPAGTQSGMSFISDGIVIIQGDFNLHGSAGTLEEFSDFLMQSATAANFFNNFYDRAILDLGRFSNTSTDNWRPAEILGDAVYIHSGTFQDGSVETAYVAVPGTRPDGGAFNGQPSSVPAGGMTSYHNANLLAGQSNANAHPTLRPPYIQASTILTNQDVVARENPRRSKFEDPALPVANPIYFDRNGEAYYYNDNNNDNPPVVLAQRDGIPNSEYHYWGFGNRERFLQMRDRNLMKAAVTRVNALIISGIVPNRPGQSYGGLHNFPRMSENWTGVNQFISGGFYQLFFSNTATAPFDMNRWERNDPLRDLRMFHSYQAPNRVWGYDVALQYSTPHPLSLRFVTAGSTRSEFYRELPIDDPYVRVLQCARPRTGATLGARLDSRANCTGIP